MGVVYFGDMVGGWSFFLELYFDNLLYGYVVKFCVYGKVWVNFLFLVNWMFFIDVKFKVLEDRCFVIRYDDSVILSMYIFVFFEVGCVVELVGCCFSKD